VGQVGTEKPEEKGQAIIQKSQMNHSVPWQVTLFNILIGMNCI
jgi:hypothetical protein